LPEHLQKEIARQGTLPLVSPASPVPRLLLGLSTDLVSSVWERRQRPALVRLPTGGPTAQSLRPGRLRAGPGTNALSTWQASTKAALRSVPTSKASAASPLLQKIAF